MCLDSPSSVHKNPAPAFPTSYFIPLRNNPITVYSPNFITQIMASSSDIHNWFSTLFPYRLDLIGDYAGTEHFVIDGDSLIRDCLCDRRIDFSQGFQLLHAVYQIERFIQSLKRRKCYFYVTFFEEHADLAIPGRAQKKDLAKWKFARETLKRHLLETVNDQLEGEQLAYGFEGLGDPRFKQFLEAKRPYFFMAHDGDDVDEDEADESASVEDWRLKQVVKTYMEMGYNVALINQVKFEDTKVSGGTEFGWCVKDIR